MISNLYEFQSFNVYGILVDLLLKILNVFIIGFHFYPVLLCVEFKRRSKLSFFLCSVYMWLLFIYYVFSNELCKREEIDMKTVMRSLYSNAKDFVTGFGISNDLNFSSIAVKVSSFKNKSKIYKISDALKNRTSNFTLKKNLVQRSKETLKFEELVFYIILCLIAVNLTVEYILIVLRMILKFDRFVNSLNTLLNSINTHLKINSIPN